MQTQKKESQTQMELLQKREKKFISQVKDTKKNMAQTKVDWAEMINDKISVQVLDALRENTMQAQTQENEPIEKF
jgi:hypothetical protein